MNAKELGRAKHQRRLSQTGERTKYKDLLKEEKIKKTESRGNNHEKRPGGKKTSTGLRTLMKSWSQLSEMEWRKKLIKGINVCSAWRPSGVFGLSMAWIGWWVTFGRRYFGLRVEYTWTLSWIEATIRWSFEVPVCLLDLHLFQVGTGTSGTPVAREYARRGGYPL